MIKILVLLTASMMLLVAASAQTPVNTQIAGTVSDSLGKTPLPNASVVLINKTDTSQVLRTVSDSKGQFSFRSLNAAVYDLKIVHTGYRVFLKQGIRPGGKNEQLAILLTPDNKQLQGVTVTAAAQKPLITMSADKMTLNVAQSSVAAGGNAYDVILRAPGVVDQNGTLSLSGKTVNVLIDGRPVHLSGEQLKIMLTNMPANGISKVDVISNPSAKYDAQGASIINIIMAKNQNYGMNGIFTQGIGTGKYLRANSGLSLNYRNKNINVYGSYDYMRNKTYIHTQSTRILDADAHILTDEYELRNKNNHAYKLGFDYDINKKSTVGILVKGFTNLQDRTVTNTAVVDHLKTNTDSSSVVHTNGNTRFFNPSVNIYYKTTFDTAGKKELTLNADYFNYNKQWSDDFITRYYNASGAEYLLPFILMNNSPADNNILSFTADYSHTNRFGKWEAGIKTAFTKTDNDVLWQQLVNNNWSVDAGKTNHFIYRENINAAYLTLAKTIKKFSLQMGVRLEQTNTEGTSITLNQVNKNNYTNLFPNVSVAYALSAKHQLNISYRKSIQRFGFDYVNPFVIYQNQYAYTQGNPNIQPMTLHSIDLGHSFNYKLFIKLGYTRINNVLGPVYRQDPANNAIISSYGNLSASNIFRATVTSVKSFFKGKWGSINTVGAFYAKYNTASSGAGQENAKVTAFISSNNTITLPKKIKAEITGFYFSPIAVGVYQQKAIYTVSAGLSRPILDSKGTLALNVSDIFNSQRTKNDVITQGVNMNYNNKPETRFVNMVFTYRFGNNKVKASKVRKTGNEDEKSRVGTTNQ